MAPLLLPAPAPQAITSAARDSEEEGQFLQVTWGTQP